MDNNFIEKAYLGYQELVQQLTSKSFYTNDVAVYSWRLRRMLNPKSKDVPDFMFIVFFKGSNWTYVERKLNVTSWAKKRGIDYLNMTKDDIQIFLFENNI